MTTTTDTPVGHILCSGSNDHTCKFWTRNRPGDTMRDKYNLNTMPYAATTVGADGDETPAAVGAYGQMPQRSAHYTNFLVRFL